MTSAIEISRKVNDAVALYRQIRKDYAYEDDVMCDEDTELHRAKYIINRVLSPADRTYLLLYTELQSYRKLGDMVGLSHTSIANEINRIKDILDTIMDKKPRFQIGDVVFVDYEGIDEPNDHYEPEYSSEPEKMTILRIEYEDKIPLYVMEEGNRVTENLVFQTELDAWRHKKIVCESRMMAFDKRKKEIEKEIKQLSNNNQTTTK